MTHVPVGLSRIIARRDAHRAIRFLLEIIIRNEKFFKSVYTQTRDSVGSEEDGSDEHTKPESTQDDASDEYTDPGRIGRVPHLRCHHKQSKSFDGKKAET